jgi:hypothetical protein
MEKGIMKRQDRLCCCNSGNIFSVGTGLWFDMHDLRLVLFDQPIITLKECGRLLRVQETEN